MGSVLLLHHTLSPFTLFLEYAKRGLLNKNHRCKTFNWTHKSECAKFDENVVIASSSRESCKLHQPLHHKCWKSYQKCYLLISKLNKNLFRQFYFLKICILFSYFGDPRLLNLTFSKKFKLPKTKPKFWKCKTIYFLSFITKTKTKLGQFFTFLKFSFFFPQKHCMTSIK